MEPPNDSGEQWSGEKPEEPADSEPEHSEHCEEEVREPLLSHSSEESERYEEMEQEVKMGIYGNMRSISRTKSKTIILKLEDVLVKNHTH